MRRKLCTGALCRPLFDCACDAGNIYFGVMAAFSKLQLAMFGMGVAILMAGIYFLIPPDSDTGKAPQVPAALLHTCYNERSAQMQALGRLHCWRT